MPQRFQYQEVVKKNNLVDVKITKLFGQVLPDREESDVLQSKSIKFINLINSGFTVQVC